MSEFILGLVIGVYIGVMIMALISSGGNDD